MTQHANPSEDYSAVNLRRLLVLRAVAVLGQVAAIGVAAIALKLTLPLRPLGAVLAAAALFNVVSWARFRASRTVNRAEFFVQLLFDAAALTLLLYFTGGSTNPFVSLLLLPLVTAAATLPAAYTWVMAAVTVACYTVLMFFYVPLPAAMDQGHGFDLHIWGMWVGFFLSAGLIAYFVVKMGDTLRARDRALAQAREETLHAERLLALGTLAAGTAHEFGTPLATMAVLAKELQRDHAAMPALAAKLQVLRDQIERCKHILATMSASAGQLQAAGGGGVLLNHYLEQTLAEWRATRPGVQLQSRCEGPRPVARIVAEQTLTQALLNILNNAADASPHCVEVEALWSERELTIEVRDRGQGVTPEVESQAGQPFFSTKAPGQGLGLGLFLAHTTISRLGGSVRLFNRDGGGACTRVILPLSPLLAAA